MHVVIIMQSSFFGRARSKLKETRRGKFQRRIFRSTSRSSICKAVWEAGFEKSVIYLSTLTWLVAFEGLQKLYDKSKNKSKSKIEFP
jgi:hypothetical protein